MAGYREFAVPERLRGLVECGWESAVRADEPARRQRVLPDGCIDLIWTGGEAVVAGPASAAFLVDESPGQRTVGLRFRPGAAPALLGLPAHALRDGHTGLAEVRPALVGAIERRLSGGDGPDAALTGAVLDGLPEAEPPAAGLRRAAALLARGETVAATATELGWTSRTLHRRALDGFGYGPAVLRRVLRFRRATALAWAGEAPAEVAARAGYADQAHLSREVRELAGAPLGRLLTEWGR